LATTAAAIDLEHFSLEPCPLSLNISLFGQGYRENIYFFLSRQNEKVDFSKLKGFLALDKKKLVTRNQ
jgi:hypothetical protein